MTSDKAVTAEQRINALLGDQTDWADFGTMTNGWSKTGGFVCRYRRTIGSLVSVQMNNLNVGTTTNGTTIISGAQGLPAGFRPDQNTWVFARTDLAGNQSTAFMFGTDGHIECWGIASTATRCDCYTIIDLAPT